MGRHRGPVEKLSRREGVQLYLKGERVLAGKSAIERRGYPPGQLYAQLSARVTASHLKRFTTPNPLGAMAPLFSGGEYPLRDPPEKGVRRRRQVHGSSFQKNERATAFRVAERKSSATSRP